MICAERINGIKRRYNVHLLSSIEYTSIFPDFIKSLKLLEEMYKDVTSEYID
jgi:hypothetical protein